MDKWRTTLRVEEIRREIIEIREADRIYKWRRTHIREEIAQHEKRQHRIQEIIVELNTLLRRSAT
jgi:hypothetical protein